MPRLMPLLFVTALLSATAVAAAEPSDGDRGRVLIQRYCAGCHAVGRKGASPNPASPPFRELNRRYHIDDLGEALAEGILTGHPAMPEFRFPPEDIAAILQYLKTIQTRQEAAGPGSSRPVL